MKRYAQKMTAAIVTACLIFGCIPAQSVLADPTEDADTEAVEQEDSEYTESVEDASEASEEIFEEDAEAQESEVVPDEEIIDFEAEDEEVEEEALTGEGDYTINHMVVVSPYLETSGTEQIMLSYGCDYESVEEMVLHVQDADGNISDWPVSGRQDNLYLFEQTFEDSSASGVYEVVSIGLTDNTGEHTLALADYSMTAQFGVNEKYARLDNLQPLNAEEEDYEDVDATVVSIEGLDEDEAVDKIATTLENAEESNASDASAISTLSAVQTLATSKDVVVAIDPGHDSTHQGTHANGLKEEELTLKIAQYCKAELETYSGVSVYMTRTSVDCPYPSTKSSSSGSDIALRVQAAVNAGASIYVAIHLNDAGDGTGSSTSAMGAEVIIPNDNWKPSVASESRKLAQDILEELEAVGVHMRDRYIYSESSSSSTYSDGSARDYYAVHSNCKEYGIPGIIVENAFQTNDSDVKNYLSSESGLKKLGVADAAGIAKYLGLSKGSNLSTPSLKAATSSNGEIKVEWSSVSGASGYRVFRKTSGGSWSNIGLTTSTSYTDSKTEVGTTYYYTVRAYKGTQSEALANTYSTTYWSGYNSTGVSAKGSSALSTPTLKSATTTSGSIKVTWSSVSRATGYRVYRKTSSTGWGNIGLTTSTSYTDSTAKLGTTYYYTVRAYKGSQSTALANTYYGTYWSGYNSTGLSAKVTSVLDTPSLGSATAADGAIKVTWSSVSGATGYRVFRKTSSTGWGNIGLTTSTSYTDQNVTIGTTYYYTVRAYKGTQSTALNHCYDGEYWSSYNGTGVSAKAKTAVDTPTLKSATVTDGSIKIEWGSVSGADGYRVFRKTSSTGWGNIDVTTSTSYTDSNVDIGTTYYYTVRAYKGDQSTALKNTYSAKYWSDYDSKGVSAKGTAVVSTPSLKSATATEGTIKVSWSSVSGASGYRVFRKTSGSGWGNIGVTTSTSYTDSNVSVGTTYYYTVRAYKGNQSTALSHTYKAPYWSGYNGTGVSAKATGIVTTPNLSSATVTNGSIKVSWGSVSGATGYRVFRKTSGSGWGNIGLTTSTSYTDSNVDIGTTYYYTVRAYKGDQSTALKNTYFGKYWSGYDSTGVSAKGTSALSTPTLKSAISSGGEVTVSWSSVSGATGYRVFRKTSGGSWGNIGLTTSTSYTDSTAKVGTTYYYTVRAYKGDQSTALSHTYKAPYWSGYNGTGVSVKVVSTLSTPTLGSATSSSGTIKVTWSAVTGATGYRVFRKTSSTGWGNIGLTTSTSYTDSYVDVGTTYYYTVRAYKGTQSTALAHCYNDEYWSGYNGTGVSAKGTSALSTPSLKSATASDGKVTVTWGSVSGATGYRVFRKVSGGSWGNIDLTTSTSYTDSTASAGKSYIYTVRAYKGDQSTALAHCYQGAYWSSYDSTGISASLLTTPVLSGTSVTSDGIKVSWKSVSGATGYRAFRKTSSTGWENVGLTTSTSYTDKNGGSYGTTYYYTVRAYVGDQSTALAHTYDSAYWSGYDSTGVSGSAYGIMGTSSVTASQLVASYGNASINSKVNCSLEELAQIFVDEAKAEGVRVEVAWCQTILETGWLKFENCDVSPTQNNFAGIGATGNGEPGNSFSSPTEGVRAQIQHLKAYASTAPLNKTCVDPRFSYVLRGCAPYVELLSEHWATGSTYGEDIVRLIKQTNLQGDK